jgi:CCR4-NOT transcriptional regulation complex NOT5 subunit
MNWYLAKMIFRIICGDGNHTAQFDEQLRLIAARSKEEAFHKAQLLGGKEEEMFFNRNQQLVQWQFISVSELYRLNELIDGAEVYSRIEEKEHVESYLHVIYKKAEQIRFGNTLEILNLA